MSCPLNPSCSLPNGHTACCSPITRADFDTLRENYRFRNAQCERLILALEEIADADYRGNRSHESELAYRALATEGLRP